MASMSLAGPAGEEAHRARLLLSAGLIVSAVGALMLASQLAELAFAVPPPPLTDLVMDAAALLIVGATHRPCPRVGTESHPYADGHQATHDHETVGATLRGCPPVGSSSLFSPPERAASGWAWRSSRDLLEANGGKIDAESEEGERDS